MFKLGEYEMWEIRIKQYFHIQDYALWEVIENGNLWVPIPVTATETGPSTGLKMTVPSTAEEKICKKNDVKARSLLLMALPNEHQLTFDQYVDAQSMFATIKARFGGNEATKKTQKALLKQQYENFNASSSESLDSIFNRLQKLVSRLAILGVVTPPEDLNVKFLRSLPSEWDTHVVVWMNKPDFDTMGLDDLYNNFKIVEQKVKRSAGANNDDKNLAFLTTSGASSTNNINTVNPEVSTGTTKVNTASTETSTASFSDATVYAFLSTQPQGSQLVHEDLEQLHDDDLEEMDLKWNMALLSMRARKFYQRTGRKIIIDGSSTAGYDKSKVECFNCHKMGHFARECRAPRSKDNRNWNQGSSSKAVRIEDASEKAMCAIDGAGFDWSDMAEEEIQANMALMAFSDSEVTNDKSCSKSCLQNYEALKKQYDDLLVKLDDTGFKASTYKRGHSSTNDVNTANVHVSTSSTPVSTASANNSTACISDATVYAYLATQPNGSQVVHEDLEQIHEVDLDEMDLKWQLALRGSGRNLRVKRTGTEFQIAQGRTSRYGRIFFKQLYLKSKYDKLRIELNKSESDLDSYKKGLASVEEQLVFYKKNESMLCDQIVVLKRDALFNESDINALKKQPEFEGYGVTSENISKEVKKTSNSPIIEYWVFDCDEDETVVLESLNVQKPKQADQPRKGQSDELVKEFHPIRFIAGSYAKNYKSMIHLSQKKVQRRIMSEDLPQPSRQQSKESHAQTLTMLMKKVKRLEDKLKL
ncbi:putative ribonuclease H-like domain-containing protein [Tanacetum coccineum]|uniref:Ribonuclease H-like domain-containing protein n=1 Tax=Tanacetum coccineum TaxID=301880 RepID=A0ABQ5G665_9ASTR